ncbi:hypothetical protein ACWGSK_04345 [Nocardiopsis sp. NPDC055551]|uniref:hypothetical protein n=1 Tax=Nocardiopsis sp. NPDC006832 TaxID=3157188 RepID=UPI0033C6CD22
MPNEPFRVLTPDALTTLDTDDRATDDTVVDTGHRPPTALVAELVDAGHTVRVRCDPAPGHEPPTPGSAPAHTGTVPVDVAEEVALASSYAWAGARVFVTRYPERVRRALDMIASIRGERPPAAVRRGLA